MRQLGWERKDYGNNSVVVDDHQGNYFAFKAMYSIALFWQLITTKNLQNTTIDSPACMHDQLSEMEWESL